MNKSFIKSFFIYGLASSVSKFIGVFLVPIYTRVFTKEEYGTLDLLVTLIAFFAILGMLQVESAVQRFYYEFKNQEERKKFLSTAFWIILVLSFLVVLLVQFFSVELSVLFFKNEEYAHYLKLMILIIPLTNLFAFLTILLRFLKQPFKYLIIVSVQLLVTVLLTIWLVVYIGVGLNGVLYGQIIGFLLPVILGFFWFKDFIFIIPSKKFLKRIINYSLPMVPSVASGWINNYANRFFMLSYLTLADIGIYSVSLKIAAVFNLFDAAFRMTWGPFLWETVTKENHIKILKQIPFVLMFGLSIGVMLIALWSKEITLLVSTNTFIKASKYLGYISLSFVLLVVLQTVNLGPAIIKKTKYNSYIAMFSASINVILLFVLVPELGLLGVALSLLISNIIRFVLSYIISEKLYVIGFPFFKLISIFVISIIVVTVLYLFDFSRCQNYMMSLFILLAAFIIIRKELKLFKFLH